MSKKAPTTQTATGQPVAPYALFYDPAKPDEARATIRAYPVPKEAGKSLPFKLASRVDVLDPKGSKGPISFSSGLIGVEDTQIKEDAEHGHFAEIVVRLNASEDPGNLTKLIEKQDDRPIPVAVTLFLDLTAVVGVMAGMALPGGTALTPVPGFTRIQIRLAKTFVLSVEKFQWAAVDRQALNELEGVVQEELADVVLEGGTLRIKLIGSADCGEETLVEFDKGIAHAQVTLASVDDRLVISTNDKPKPGKEGAPGTVRYDAGSGEYIFEIPSEDGKPGRHTARVEVTVHPEKMIEQRFAKTCREAKKVDALLESEVIESAIAFVRDYLRVLAEDEEKTLRENAEKFIRATTAVADFQAFTHLTGKGLRSALRLHSKAYDRYMENLFNAVVEFVFWLGSDITENITKRLIKGEKEVVESQLKANAKTLSEAAAESTETVVKQLKQKAKLALEQLETQMKKLRTEASELISKLRSQIDTVAHTRKEVGEKVARGEVIESQIKQLDNEISELGKHADGLRKQVAEIDGKAVDIRSAQQKVARNLDSAGQDLRRLEGELGDGAGEVRRLQNGVRELESEIDQARSLADGKKAEFVQAKQQLESAEQRLKRLKSEKLRTDTQLKSLESEQAAIDAALENGTANQAQLKRLNDLPNDRGAAADQLRQVEADLKTQSEIVSAKHGQLSEANAQLESAKGRLEGLQSQSPGLRQQLSDAEKAKAALERKVDGKRTQLGDLSQKNADLVSEEQTLRAQGEKIQGQLDGVGEQAKVKDAAAKGKTDELAAVERERAALVAKHDKIAGEMDTTAAQFRDNRQAATEMIDPLAEGHADVAKLDSQTEILEAIRNQPKGVTPEQSIEQLRAKIDALPKDSSIGEEVSRKLTGEVGLDDYRKIIEDIQNRIPADMPDAHRRQIGKNLDRMRDAMRNAVHTTDKDQALKKVLLQQTFDSIKGGLNDRASKLEQVAHSQRFKNMQEKNLMAVFDSLRERIDQRAEEIRKLIKNITHSDYKATDAKHYEGIPWGSVFAKVDAGIELLARCWNELCEFGLGLGGEGHRYMKEKWPEGVAYGEQIVLNGISVAVEMLDRLIRIVQWLLDKLVAATSDPCFAMSRLNTEARSAAKEGKGAIDSQFFVFSSEMMADVTKAAALINLVDYPSESAARSVKQSFTGAWAKHYEKQWDIARLHMIVMAEYTLDTERNWLKDSKVNADNGRQSTELMRRIVGPMAEYAGSFASDKSDWLVTALTVWETGTLTPQDVDSVIEDAGWTASMSLKIGGLILAFTPYAPSVPALMVAADRLDWLTAGLRVACSTFMTTPAILGAQFDMMSVYNLGFQARFDGKDLGDCLAPEPLPAFEEFAMVP